MTFDLKRAMENGGRCQTRDGRPARIICTDRKSPNGPPIIALVDGDCGEILHTHSLNGRRIDDGRDHSFDLVNIPVKREGWVNVYRRRDSTCAHVGGPIYTSPEQAQSFADPMLHRVACVHIEWEEPA